MYIGQKLHYRKISPYSGFTAVICTIENIQNNIITVENEFGKKFDIPAHWIDESINRIEKPIGEHSEQDSSYLQCQCGSSRFHYDKETQVISCSDCYAEYNSTEFELLNKTVNIVHKSYEIETIH